MGLPPENPLKAPDLVANPARLILILSLAPVIGLGIGRFAYSLVLPDMRDTLGWSYSVAGFMNTVNAAGYLAGALMAAWLIRRFGLSASIRWGTLACVLSLALSAVSGNLIVLSFARLLVGVGAALAFVASATMAARIAQSHPARASFLLSLFYAGPGFGILTSGLIAPFMLQVLGPGSWWIVWWAMTLLTAALTIPLLTTTIEAGNGHHDAAPAHFALRPVMIYLAGYFLFGAGYIAYMTFMIAYIRDAGGGAVAQSAFWCHRPERVCDALGMEGSIGARQWRALHRDHPRRQLRGRGAAAVWSFGVAVDSIGTGVRRILLCNRRIDHRICAFQHSATSVVQGDCGHDHRVRNRPDAGADGSRRHHRRPWQPVLCAECFSLDAGARRGGGGFSAKARQERVTTPRQDGSSSR
jgi:MFS family permease